VRLLGLPSQLLKVQGGDLVNTSVFKGSVILPVTFDIVSSQPHRKHAFQICLEVSSQAMFPPLSVISFRSSPLLFVRFKLIGYLFLRC